MNVTRDIVKDLLPLYVAGEAIADTRALVEAFMRTDAGIAREVATLGDDATPARIAMPADQRAPDRAALARTQSLLRRRTWLMAAAIFCSGLPFAFVAGNEGIRFLMFRDAPQASAALMAAAVVLWLFYAQTARRLRVTGL